MRSNTLVTRTAAARVLLAYPIAVLAYETTSTPPPSYTVGLSTSASYDACYTITTPGPTCAVASCAVPDCLKISTITQSCGCASIYTAYSCGNICANDCAGTSYNTVYIPCAESSPNLSSPGSSSVQSSSSQYSTQPPPDTSTKYGNSTITSTSTSIITISTCPASVTCTGQTTTWTSTEGPFPCTATPTCTCVLPGGGGGGISTVTGTEIATPTTTRGNVGPQPTTSIEPANLAGRSVVAEAGVLAALIAAVLGML